MSRQPPSTPNASPALRSISRQLSPTLLVQDSYRNYLPTLLVQDSYRNYLKCVNIESSYINGKLSLYTFDIFLQGNTVFDGVAI